jgi:hypothetical protein
MPKLFKSSQNYGGWEWGGGCRDNMAKILQSKFLKRTSPIKNFTRREKCEGECQPCSPINKKITSSMNEVGRVTKKSFFPIFPTYSCHHE